MGRFLDNLFGEPGDDGSEEFLTHLRKAIRSTQNLPAQDKALLKEIVSTAFQFTGIESDHTSILTVGSVIVVWRFNRLSKLLAPTQEDLLAVESQLRQILTANPNADLKRYEAALGIALEVERPSSSAHRLKGFYDADER
jgi:hypothetical protein